MDKKINLKEILYKHVYSKSDIKDLKEQMVCEEEAMLEFGKQLLKLAAENAKTFWKTPHSKQVDKQSILDTIKQIE